MKYPKQMIVAHRGASGLVKFENTIDAFKKAIEVGADCIEIDIRKTSDGKIVVFHDPKINDIPLIELTYNELLKVSNEEGFNIPTLEETLKFVRGKILVDIEFKEGGYEEEAVEIIHKYLNNDEFFIRSFLDTVLIKIKRIDSKITTALLLGKDKPKHVVYTRLSELFPLFRLLRTKANIVSPNYQLLKFGFVFRMKLIKTPISVWTVNTEKLMRKLLLKKKVAAVVTNFPDLGIKILNENNGIK